MGRLLKSRDGSVLPVVFIFSTIALISVVAFVLGQYKIARPALIAPSDVQALLNARSGIWKGLEMLSQPKGKDTLPTINTLDSLFNRSLFGKPTEVISSRNEQLLADSTPVPVQLYSSDSFGTGEVALSYRGCFEILSSKGVFRNNTKKAVVKLGGIFPMLSDTVLSLENNPPLQSPVRGKIHYGPPDTMGSPRIDDWNKLLSHYQSEMSDSVDTLKPSPPLLIQHNDEFGKIPKIVRGPLFIDGSHFDLAWKTKTKIIVLGDLQITGTAAIEGIDFLVTGEIKLFDKADLRDVFLLTPKTISIGDKAVFSGTAVTQKNIIVSGDASVQNRSMLVAIRKTNPPRPSSSTVPASRTRNSPLPAASSLVPVSPTRNSSLPASSVVPASQKRLFSITFAGSSTIDATVVTLNDTLGIKIDKNVIVKGILRTRGAMCLDGKVYGRIHASKLVDGALAMAGSPMGLKALSVIHGTVLPLEDVRGYYFPFFMGRLSIIEWREE